MRAIMRAIMMAIMRAIMRAIMGAIMRATTGAIMRAASSSRPSIACISAGRRKKSLHAAASSSSRTI
eukprot:3805766-Prymnesium_polylepis.1